MRSIRVAGLVAAIVGVMTMRVAAHHSFSAEYDANKPIKLTGKLIEMKWSNPHAWIYLEVKDPKGGEAQIWALEATGRNGLGRIGVTKEYVQPGDTIKARCHVLRDGSNGCLLGFLKAKDGSVKDWDGNNAPAPTDF